MSVKIGDQIIVVEGPITLQTSIIKVDAKTCTYIEERREITIPIIDLREDKYTIIKSQQAYSNRVH